MTGLLDILIQKRWIFIAGVFIVVDVFLVSLLASTAQAHHAQITPQNHGASQIDVAAHSYDSPNAVTNGLLMLMDSTSRVANATEQQVLGGVGSIAMGAVQSGRLVRHGSYAMVHGVGTGFAFTGRMIGNTFMLVGRSIGGGFGAIGHGVGAGFGFVGHIVVGTLRFASGITHIGSIIRPADHTDVPTITQLRAQQAALIVSDTKEVTIASMTSGTGGLCDDGDGNGGYPAAWCNAEMDSIGTIPYSGASINRECTSYAYWYFTSVEGHADFRAWGNAKYWASTSNYPVRATPTVGAIAVETAGAYGHVAIVQALAGQKLGGQTVPSGYVLVSEMNYDWNGHFRYSYSPLSKFSSYIYP